MPPIHTKAYHGTIHNILGDFHSLTHFGTKKAAIQRVSEAFVHWNDINVDKKTHVHLYPVTIKINNPLRISTSFIIFSQKNVICDKSIESYTFNQLVDEFKKISK